MSQQQKLDIFRGDKEGVSQEEALRDVGSGGGGGGEVLAEIKQLLVKGMDKKAILPSETKEKSATCSFPLKALQRLMELLTSSGLPRILFLLFIVSSANAHTIELTQDPDWPWPGKYFNLNLEGNFYGIPPGVSITGDVMAGEKACKQFHGVNGKNITVPSLSCETRCATEPMSLKIKYLDPVLNSMATKNYSVDDDGMRAASCRKGGAFHDPDSDSDSVLAVCLIGTGTGIGILLAIWLVMACRENLNRLVMACRENLNRLLMDCRENLNRLLMDCWENLNRLLRACRENLNPLPENGGIGDSTAMHSPPEGELDELRPQTTVEEKEDVSGSTAMQNPNAEETDGFIEVVVDIPTPTKDDMSSSRSKN